MTSQTNFHEGLNRSLFVRTLFITTQPIYAKHLKDFANQRIEVHFNAYGTEKEVYLKSIVSFIGLVQSYFEDLEKVVTFLRINKSQLSALYGDKIKPSDYFKYHYDNFVIRILTCIDICGKIGNVVFDLKIEDKYSNWH